MIAVNKRHFSHKLYAALSQQNGMQYLQVMKIKAVTVEPLYCRHHGTTAVGPDYRSVRISEASGIFPVGVAMQYPCC